MPLTLGLAPLLAIMQTLYYRTHDEKWNRLVRFFAVLFLINFAIGAATGLVQEFEFGMNWSSFSKYVGDVFGAPLAIEGLGAFMLESTFIGLWVFGREHLSPRLHLATIYLVWLGTWLSAYFIIVANSWMQHPVGYQINKSTGTAQATDIATIMFQRFALFAYVHVILAGCLTGGFVVLGVSAWHLRRGRNVDVFRAAAKLAILARDPVERDPALVGERVRDRDDECSADEDRLDRSALEHAATGVVLDLPDRRLHKERPDAHLLARDSGAALVPRDRLVPGQGRRTEPESGEAGGSSTGLGTTCRWSSSSTGACAIMAYLGGLMLLLALWGGWLLWRKKLERAKWFQRAAMGGIVVPFLACFGGWILTETGRQPWIVYGLQKTADAVSPSSTTTKVAFSLGVFLALYTGLAIVDFYLMRRYARLDPPETGGDAEGAAPVPAPSY